MDVDIAARGRGARGGTRAGSGQDRGPGSLRQRPPAAGARRAAPGAEPAHRALGPGRGRGAARRDKGPRPRRRLRHGTAIDRLAQRLERQLRAFVERRVTERDRGSSHAGRRVASRRRADAAARPTSRGLPRSARWCGRRASPSAPWTPCRRSRRWRCSITTSTSSARSTRTSTPSSTTATTAGSA